MKSTSSTAEPQPFMRPRSRSGGSKPIMVPRSRGGSPSRSSESHPPKRSKTISEGQCGRSVLFIFAHQGFCLFGFNVAFKHLRSYHDGACFNCSSGTLTNVLPHRNAVPQTQDIAPHPDTVYRVELSLCYPLMWNVTLEYTTTHRPLTHTHTSECSSL